MKRVLLISLSLLTSGLAVSQKDSVELKVDSLWENFVIQPDDEVLKQIDKSQKDLYSNTFFSSVPEQLVPEDSIPHVFVLLDDDTLEMRMNELNRITPFDLTYNRYVKAFINLYVNKKRQVTQRVMGVAPYYFPLFESKLDQYGLPLELKHLAIVESALNPKARSRAGALGLWQFMYTTGKMYGLRMNSYYDERMDPIKSTDAACRYLSDLYKQYKDWNLVIAAYNCGPGNVNKAIRRSGGNRDFWEIRKYLPRETRGYVPAFHAVNYTMNYGSEHGLEITRPEMELLPSDTIMVCGQLNFDVLSKALDIDIKWLEHFNPAYRYNVVPDLDENQVLFLPTEKIGLFQLNEDSLYALNLKVEKVKEEAGVESSTPSEGNHIVHRVRSGEVMGKIAEIYGVRVSQIKEWNNLWSSRIYPGQKLNIYSDKKVAVQTKTVTAQPKKLEVVKKAPTGSFTYYVIQPGDTLWDIAKKYEAVTVSDLKKWNSNLNFKKLKPGDKIKISKTS